MAGQCKVSAAIVGESEKRSYVFKIHGYSKAKELFKNGERLTSPPCSVGGYNWVLWYYPNGYMAKQAGHILLVLVSFGVKDVKVKASLSILDKDAVPAPPYIGFIKEKIYGEGRSLGFIISQASLEQSTHIIDDCLSIRCDLTLMKGLCCEETMGGDQFVVVPPSDLHRHFGNLLESMVGADVTFHVGGEKFLAHRFVLAARSSVFKAELLGAMKENFGNPIEIHEMKADVFKCLLYFIYTDSLPALEMMTSNQGEARRDVVMAGHLLVAADRYNVERLKVMCEHKLCSRIDVNMVATSLALADQHNCKGLKEACLHFLSTPSNLEKMVASDGYEHLKRSCPSALKELIAKLLPVEMKAAKDIVMSIW